MKKKYVKVDEYVTILKYPNRKLYNTETSKYTSIKELSMFNANTFKVFDKKSGVELTQLIVGLITVEKTKNMLAKMQG